MAAAAVARPDLPSFEESGASVEEIPGRGRGIVSRRAYKEGETVFAEAPLMSCQFAWNREYKYLACEFCLRSLETAQDMASRLGNQPGIDLPLATECCESRPDTYAYCDDCQVSGLESAMDRHARPIIHTPAFHLQRIPDSGGRPKTLFFLTDQFPMMAMCMKAAWS